MENDENIEGVGGRERLPSGRTPIQDGRLTALAIKRGWLKGQRWPTDATKTELQQRLQAAGDLSLRDLVALNVHCGLRSKDQRVSGIAAKTAVLMERQNQIDDLADVAVSPVNVNVGVSVNQTIGAVPEAVRALSDDDLQRHIADLRARSIDAGSGAAVAEIAVADVVPPCADKPTNGFHWGH